MTKSELRMRVLAVASGAGMCPDVDDDVWGNFCAEALCRFLLGLRSEFDLEVHHCALGCWNISNYETPLSTIEFLWSSLK